MHETNNSDIANAEIIELPMQNNTIDDSDKYIPLTTREWYEWLLREEERTVGAYRSKPEFLIKDFNSERALVRDYQGREILELLQNANDQAAEAGQRGQVLVELSPHGLIVANTGQMFSVGGVASLQTSHLSPKRHRRHQFIGNKGLGFRSILNWTSTPIILSGALSLSYCRQHAKNILEKLIGQSPDIEKLVSKEQQGKDTLILPLLPFPLFSENGDLADSLADEVAREIFERCETLLIEGYDTIIGMPFETTSVYEAACIQIDEMRSEILLFVQHLGELRFRQDGKVPITWRRKGGSPFAEVLANGEPLGKWKIHRDAGKLPASVVESDQTEATEYEIVVAVPQDGKNVPGFLFSHFPTDIALPLPLTCHVTLELEQNRKHAQQCRRCNQYVFDRLAEFLGEIAEYAAAEATDDPWVGFSLIMANEAYSSELMRESFPEKVIESAKARHIIPTLGGQYVTPRCARLVPGADPSWLPSELFPEVVPIKEGEYALALDLLDVPALDVVEIKKRIVTFDNFTTEQRIALIKGLLDQRNLSAAYTSSLLIDASGHPLRDDMRVFLSPSGGAVPNMPEWAKFRFLNEEMQITLTQTLKARDNRDLQQKLSGFGVQSYSLDNIIRALVAEANRAEKANSEQSATLRMDLLRTVFELFTGESGTKRPDFPSGSTLYLFNQAQSEAAASTLYIGSGFDPQGEIVQALYGSWAPEQLVDAEWLNGLTQGKEKLIEFLLWIGVARWPRDTVEFAQSHDYKEYALRTIPFPASFEDKVIASASEATGAFVSNVASVNGLKEILCKAEPTAIVAWQAIDHRAFEWGRPMRKHAQLKASPDGVYKPRIFQGPLPSYVRWCLETTFWLRTPDGKPIRPKDCVLGERAMEELFPRPSMPDQDRLNHFGIQQADVLEGWRHTGVLTSIAYLERDEIYAKLLELPQRSPDGKLARPLYHWLLDANEHTLGADGPNQKEFLASGRMWGRHGEKQNYFPIAELYHADTEGLPEALLQNLKIVDLRKRVGADKVKKLFGIKPLERSEIQPKPIVQEIAVGSVQANTTFQEAKPYLHKLRASQTSQLSQLQALKDLKLEVCSKLRARLTFEGVPFEYEVPVWGWLIDEKTLSVRSNPAKSMSLASSLLFDAIGEALASIFRIADGGDFARMLACPEEDRLELLRRLAGEAALEDIEAIRIDYASFKPNIVIEASFPVTDPPKVISPITGEPKTPISESNKNETSPDKTLVTPNSPVTITDEEHMPKPAPDIRKLQIKSVTSGTNWVKNGHSVTDGDFCERKTIEFEEANGRWTLPVGQIMGAEGPGCDVLSFASQADKEAFILGPTRDLNTVLRFIEVKGRNNPGASIELKGNELSAAESYGYRYFLYRLFEKEDASFELTVLQNPLIHNEALHPAVYVSMDSAKSTQRFSLSGGVVR